MTDAIDREFADLDRLYPGSRRPRREPVRKTILARPLGWDHSPIVRTLPNGTVVDMFLVGALSEALNRPVVTLRNWERNGYIPTAPYRWRSGTSSDSKQAGKRLYSRSIIERTVLTFSEHGLLEARRIDWSRHADLSIQLFQEWKSLHRNETST